MESQTLITESQIIISTPPFSRERFFGSGMGVAIELGEHFVDLVIPEIDMFVPASQGLIVASHDLMEFAIDQENLAEIGNRRLFRPNEWAQIIFFGFMSGRKNLFKNNSSMNLSYLELKDKRTLAVYTRLNSEYGIWRAAANPIDDKRREDVEDIGRRLLYRDYCLLD
jgi:hypothetical protein